MIRGPRSMPPLPSRSLLRASSLRVSSLRVSSLWVSSLWSPRTRRALVVFAHPVRDSLVGAAYDQCVGALRSAGAEVRCIELCQDGFDPVLSREAWKGHLAPLSTKPEIAAHAALLQWADTLVLVYPTWYSGQPAILKGWFDRVWVEGVAYTLPLGASRIRPLLRNLRRLNVVTTHGSNRRTNALQGATGRRFVSRGLRTLVHPLCRVDWVGFYGNDHATNEERVEFLDRVKHSAAQWCGPSGV